MGFMGILVMPDRVRQEDQSRQQAGTGCYAGESGLRLVSRPLTFFTLLLLTFFESLTLLLDPFVFTGCDDLPVTIQGGRLALCGWAVKED